MNFKNYSYVADDGHHFPDAYAGDIRVYEVDFSEFAEAENSVLLGVEWEVEAGAEEQDTWENLPDSKVAILVSTPIVGSFRINCRATLLGQQETQVVHIPLIVKVF